MVLFWQQFFLNKYSNINVQLLSTISVHFVSVYFFVVVFLLFLFIFSLYFLCVCAHRLFSCSHYTANRRWAHNEQTSPSNERKLKGDTDHMLCPRDQKDGYKMPRYLFIVSLCLCVFHKLISRLRYPPNQEREKKTNPFESIGMCYVIRIFLMC